MLLLFEEIAVESAMILATLVALGLLVYVLVGFALEHARARQDAPARSFTRAHSQTTIGRRA